MNPRAPGDYYWGLAKEHPTNQLLFIRASVGNEVNTFSYVSLGNSHYGTQMASVSKVSRGTSKTGSAVDTLKVTAEGYLPQSIALTDYDIELDVTLEIDPKICANQYYTLLSGGCNAPSKTWVVYNKDSAFAIGPPAERDSSGNGASSYSDSIVYWWNSYVINGIPAPGSLDDEYIFELKDFAYQNDCKGDFYFNWKWANYLFGAHQLTYADTVYGYTPNNPATWKLEKIFVTDTTGGKKGTFVDDVSGESFNLIVTLSKDNYIGYGSGTSIYQILNITENAMFLRHEFVDPEKPLAIGINREEWRYLRLTAKE